MALGLRGWAATRGHWKALDAELNARADREALRPRCNELVRLWVKRGCYEERLLRDVLPSFLRACRWAAPAGALLSLWARAVRKDSTWSTNAELEELTTAMVESHRHENEFDDTVTALERCYSVRLRSMHGTNRWHYQRNLLLKAVRELPPRLVAEGLRIAASAEDVGLEVLKTLLPALARQYSDPDLLLDDISVYRRIGAALGPGGEALWSSLAQHATQQRSRRLFVANGTLYLLCVGKDAQAFIAWAGGLPESLPEPTFERLVEAGIELVEQSQQPAVLLSGLAGSSGSPHDFTGAELQAIVEILGRFPEKRSGAAAFVPACAACSPARRRLVIDFTGRQLDRNLDPGPAALLIPALAELDDAAFAAAMDLMAEFAASGSPLSHDLPSALVAAAQYLMRPDYHVVLEAALDLLHRKSDPLTLIRNAPRLALSTGDLRSVLVVISDYLARTSKWDSAWQPARAVALEAVPAVDSVPVLQEALANFERLVAAVRETACNGLPGNLSDLFRQLIATLKEYADFRLVYHPAETHEESNNDPYSSGSTYTVEDEPARLELLPSGDGRRRVDVQPCSPESIETALAERSWLWRDDPHSRTRAMDRLSAVARVLPSILDSARRCGLFSATDVVNSVYLYGSYLWLENPNDVDLFLVLRGRRELVHHQPSQLAAVGFAVPEIPIKFDIEVVGHETIRAAYRDSDPARRPPLALQFLSLFGAARLAGVDLHRGVTPSQVDFDALQERLIEDGHRALWVDLSGKESAIATKRAWRLREATAVAKFLRNPSK